MHGLTLWVVEVDGGALVVVPLDLPQVHPQVVAEFAEFRLAGVEKAELEGCKGERQVVSLRWVRGLDVCVQLMAGPLTLLGDVMVQPLHLGVVP